VAVARPLYLLDTSALVWLKHEQVDQVVTPLTKRGQVATCGVTDLEVLHGARSPAEYETVWAHRLAAYRQHLPITERVVERAVEYSALLRRLRNTERSASLTYWWQHVPNWVTRSCCTTTKTLTPSPR
jgi:predicted nucleic acid-binding protein